MTAGHRAELIADRGVAAASEADFFRSPAYLATEGVTHTLAIDGSGTRVSIPLVVRDVPGGAGIDGVSPYGYPGGLVEGDGDRPAAGAIEWGDTGLLSVFVRDSLGAPALAPASGAAPTAVVRIHEPARPRQVRARLTEQVRAAERAGWTVETSPGEDIPAEQLDRFVAIYEQTMRRTDAGERYFFDRAVYEAALSISGSALLLAHSPAGEPAAAAIVTPSDGHLHYFLGGTADSALAESPFKSVVVAMLDLADEAGQALNLGGGLSAGDGLERFKRGFANAEAPWFAHRIVCDQAVYAELSAGREGEEFFPAYRAE